MDRVAPAEGQSRTFLFLDDPREIPNPRTQEENERLATIYRGMSAREKLPGFDPKQKGALSMVISRQIYDADINMNLPTGVRGYNWLLGRMRERQHPLHDVNAAVAVRLAWVMRRSPRMQAVSYTEAMRLAESDPTHSYYHRARKTLEAKHPNLFQAMTQENCMKLVIASQMLNYCRLEAMLVKSACWIKLDPQGRGRWKAVYLEKPTEDMLYVYAFTVGEWAVIEHGKFRMTLLVEGMCEDGLLLKFGTRDLEGEMEIPEEITTGQFETFLKFIPRDMQYQIPLTATVDGLSAMADVFLPTKPPSLAGSPLITKEQLLLLEAGLGFENPNLDEHQREAVVWVLTHRCPRTVQSLIGPPGTGKSNVLDEVVLQILYHHTGQLRSDALIHIAIPTNAGCKATAERLITKGLPAELVLRLVSDQEKNRCVDSNHRTEMVSRYRIDPKVQVVIGTPTVLARICMSNDKLYNIPPMLVILDEVGAMGVGEALAPCVLNGEPESILIARDPLQLSPRSISKLSESIAGTKTLFDILQLSGWYFSSTLDSYLNPIYLVGTRLFINYRAHPQLVKLVSDVFYNGCMLTPEDTSAIEAKCADLWTKLHEANLFTDATGQFLWVNHNSPARRDQRTHSLFNDLEAWTVSDMVHRLQDVIGASNIMVLSPYRKQVLLLKEQLAENSGLLVRSVDESQGLERPVCVISLVRDEIDDDDNPLGFLSDFNRINVMISRAQQLVIVVGSVNHFRKSEVPYWMDLLDRADVVSF